MENEEFLLSILEDDDEANASLAIKELLNSENVEKIIAANLDSPSEKIRRRIHAMTCILERSKLKANFPELVSHETLSPWECLVILNAIVDFRASANQLNGMLSELMEDVEGSIVSSDDFQNFAKNFGIIVDESIDNFITKFLLTDVLVHENGDPLVVAIILQQACQFLGWKTRLGSYKGVPCLLDQHNQVLLMNANMDMKTDSKHDFASQSVKSVALKMLSRMYSAACVDQITAVMLDTRELLNKLLMA